MSKWNKQYFRDLGERVGSTALYGTITVITMDNVLEGPDFDTVLWPVLVLPTALSLLKGLLANMTGSGPEPSASLTSVSSNPT